MARAILSAKLAGIDAAISAPVGQALKRVLHGVTNENLVERAQYLGALLASRCAVSSAVGEPSHLAFGNPGGDSPQSSDHVPGAGRRNLLMPLASTSAADGPEWEAWSMSMCHEGWAS